MENIIRIKIGDIEIEGNEIFVLNKSADLLKQLLEIIGKNKPVLDEGLKDSGIHTTKQTDRSAKFYAEKFGFTKSGPDVVKAAVLKLVFSDKKNEFSRLEILEEMKKCVGIYTPNMRSNLSKILKRLEGEVLIKVADDRYNIVDKFRKAVEGEF